MIAPAFDELLPLVGTWKGRGTGRFPTIPSFDYTEQIDFVAETAYPLLAYEQRTWLGNGDAAHWESGFWRPGPEGSVEVSNAQESGRVEVLSGQVRITDEGTEIELHSLLHGHDARLIRTRRSFRLLEDRLTYVVEMATHTTHRPQLQQHLVAELRRESR